MDTGLIVRLWIALIALSVPAAIIGIPLLGSSLDSCNKYASQLASLFHTQKIQSVHKCYRRSKQTLVVGATLCVMAAVMLVSGAALFVIYGY